MHHLGMFYNNTKKDEKEGMNLENQGLFSMVLSFIETRLIHSRENPPITWFTLPFTKSRAIWAEKPRSCQNHWAFSMLRGCSPWVAAERFRGSRCVLTRTREVTGSPLLPCIPWHSFPCFADLLYLFSSPKRSNNSRTGQMKGKVTVSKTHCQFPIVLGAAPSLTAEGISGTQACFLR